MGKARSAQEALQAEVDRLTAQLADANTEAENRRADAQKATELAAEAASRATRISDDIRKRRQALELLSGSAMSIADDEDDEPVPVDGPDGLTVDAARAIMGVS